MSERSAQFLAIAEAARELAGRESELDTATLDALEAAAEQVGKSWSKSNLGYQANVYYDGFTTPPPGAVFSREWGFEGFTLGSRGDWRPFEAADVVRFIANLAGNPDLTPVSATADEIRAQVTDLLERARSLAARTSLTDDYLKENIEALGYLSLPDRSQLAQAQMHTASEDAAGKLNARANVIHEVGLFQGRLGWMKAIVLLEDGCEEFSNIDGVGQIRYPKGNISAKFDEIRQVLQRESVL